MKNNEFKTAICIASGPSLTLEDVEYCRGKGTVYAVKECHILAPWADVLYAADGDWWEKFKGCPEFAGRRWTVDPEIAIKYSLNCIKYETKLLWSTDPCVIATGHNSGFQAINLAALHGHERIILLGYDMGHAPGMDKHWWEQEHPRESRYSNYKKWIEHMDKAAPLIKQSGIEVLNATRCTAITCFPQVNLREVL